MALGSEREAAGIKSSEDIREDLECPVCFKIPRTTPIYQCEQGHIHCKTCHPRLRDCPICRGPIGNTRNLVVEKIISKLPVQCANFENGCPRPALAVSQPHPGCPRPALAASQPHPGPPQPVLAASRPQPGCPRPALAASSPHPGPPRPVLAASRPKTGCPRPALEPSRPRPKLAVTLYYPKMV